MTEFHIKMLEASEAKAAKRSETLDELRGWLEQQHTTALEESPYSFFVSRLPVELMAHLTPQERAQLETSELEAFHRHQPLAQTRAEQLAAFVRAGGTPEAFERNWEDHGRDAHVAAVAGEQLRRAHQDDVF